MTIIVKWLIFLILVIVIPIICNKIICKIDKGWNGIGFAFGVILLCVWLLGLSYMGNKLPTQWVTTGEYHLSGLSSNTYIKSHTGKSSVSNYTSERYDYIINESNGYRNYWVNADYASVKIKNDALDLVIQKEVTLKDSFISKYIVPDFFYKNESTWYTFYVDPVYAQEMLGIRANK